MCSFYARRSQKRKKYCQALILFFALLGSAHVKAVCKMLMKLTPGSFDGNYIPEVIIDIDLICRGIFLPLRCGSSLT